MAKGQKPIRPVRFLTDVAVIQLTKGKFTIIDIDDVQKVDDRNWYGSARGGRYASAMITKVKGKQREQMYLHKVILNVPGGMQVDHINGNNLDNRKSNLRAATHGENQQNRSKIKNGSSKFKGVTFCKMTRKFKAQIGFGGEHRNIGYYTTAEEAARSYDTEARIHHGEFARLNFPN